MMRTYGWLVMVALLAGCAAFQGGSDTDQAVLATGDLGAIGCAAVAIEAKPADRAQAMRAVGSARDVLASDAPTMALLTEALAVANLDPRWKALSGVVVQRIERRIGNVDPLPKDGVGLAMAQSFVDACSAALGAA
jgi:hypothetical protein